VFRGFKDVLLSTEKISNFYVNRWEIEVFSAPSRQNWLLTNIKLVLKRDQKIFDTYFTYIV